jgi:hypothetical protein
VFTVMRTMRDEQTQLYEKGRIPYEQIAVGGACADDIFRAEVGRMFLAALNKGVAPSEASADAFEKSKVLVREHNARRPKDFCWQRWEGSGESVARLLGERIAHAAKKVGP